MPRKAADLKGKKVGLLTVIDRVNNDPKGKPMWLCECECGNKKVISSSALQNGVKSCGCYRRKWAKETHTKHGFTSHRETKERLFNIWWRMKQRCNDSHTDHFKDYGGRGIKICPEWDDYGTFRSWAMSNGYADNLTIDRVDVNGNYEPSNCRWVTKKQQARNTRTNHLVEYDGRVACVAEWAEDYNLPYNKLLYELNKAKKEGKSETGVLKGFILRGFIYG